MAQPSPQREDSAAPACPFCRAGHGRARSVTANATERIISYVCSWCQRRWDVTDRLRWPSLFRRA